MEMLRRIEAVALPLPTANVDTDQIIPARFLWHAQTDGYGQWLFNDLRFAVDGSRKNEFILNDPRYADAKIIIGERNFGCGSSREQAVWALHDYGFRVVIAPSFGDIFYNNCFKQGLLPISLPSPEVALLRETIEQTRDGIVTVDLQMQSIAGPGGFSAHFDIVTFRRKQLLEGLDDIALTLAHTDALAAFEAVFDRDLPWLAPHPSQSGIVSG